MTSLNLRLQRASCILQADPRRAPTKTILLLSRTAPDRRGVERFGRKSRIRAQAAAGRELAREGESDPCSSHLRATPVRASEGNRGALLGERREAAGQSFRRQPTQELDKCRRGQSVRFRE